MRKTTLCYISRIQGSGEKEYLMLRRTAKKNDGSVGKWMGVGGKIENDETPDSCILREVKEETGLEIKNYNLRGIVYYYSDIWEDEIMYLYSADAFTGELIDYCDEGELQWIAENKLMELNMWEGDIHFLKPLLANEDNIRLKLRYEGDKLVSWENISD
ncbi:MAG: 8-oxo-dGTP diphosphatase [Lachnospiraceae bacterium]|nr:8-oxo-dGTP diphosphatase [Lachnospiraceae bacterium]